MRRSSLVIEFVQELGVMFVIRQLIWLQRMQQLISMPENTHIHDLFVVMLE